MAQTPQQRRANAKFDKINEKKMGKPTTAFKKKDKPKSPVSPIWLWLLAFVIIAPLGFELFRIFPIIAVFFTDALRSIGIISK